MCALVTLMPHASDVWPDLSPGTLASISAAKITSFVPAHVWLMTQSITKKEWILGKEIQFTSENRAGVLEKLRLHKLSIS